MNANNLLQAGIFLVVLLALAVPVAGYLTRVMDGSSRVLRVFGPFERALFRIAGVDAGAEMSWKQYALAAIAFNAWACSSSTCCCASSNGCPATRSSSRR